MLALPAGKNAPGSAIRVSLAPACPQVLRRVGRVEDVIVGARGSRLAQAMVKELIGFLGTCPVVRFRVRSVMIGGDSDCKTSVRHLGGEDGVFITGLEEELLAGRVDIAVHSLKDLPVAPPGRPSARGDAVAR